MRLLYIVADSNYFLSHRLALAQAAIKEGIEVGLASTDFSSASLEKMSALSFYPVKFKRGGLNPFREVFTLYSLYKIIKIFKPTHIHAVALKPSLYGTLLARVLKIKIINSINGFGYVFTSQTVRARLLKFIVTILLRLILNHKSVHVIVQNNADSMDCQSILPCAAIHLVPSSGVNTQTFTPKKTPKRAHPFTFTLVARMLWSKGIGEFVAAAYAVKKNYKNVKFLLVGAPDNENPESISSEQLKSWHEEGIVEWIGYCKDINHVYQQTNVAVLPSYREGMPKSLLEAMACGLPILTTNARGCAELVENNINGFTVPVGSVDGLIKFMEIFIKEPERAIEMGLASRSIVEKHYDQNIINNIILKLYRKL